MKLVIDTSTIISGSLWHGPPARLLSAALRGHARMFLSLPLLLELQETLQHPKFAPRLIAQGETAGSIANRFRGACHEAVPAKIVLPAELRDPDDSHVLACAVAAEADVIVTGDKDLLTLGVFQNIPIINAQESVAPTRIGSKVIQGRSAGPPAPDRTSPSPWPSPIGWEREASWDGQSMPHLRTVRALAFAIWVGFVG